jgi:hypothetical protein
VRKNFNCFHSLWYREIKGGLVIFHPHWFTCLTIELYLFWDRESMPGRKIRNWWRSALVCCDILRLCSPASDCRVLASSLLHNGMWRLFSVKQSPVSIASVQAVKPCLHRSKRTKADWWSFFFDTKRPIMKFVGTRHPDERARAGRLGDTARRSRRRWWGRVRRLRSVWSVPAADAPGCGPRPPDARVTSDDDAAMTVKARATGARGGWISRERPGPCRRQQRPLHDESNWYHGTVLRPVLVKLSLQDYSHVLWGKSTFLSQQINNRQLASWPALIARLDLMNHIF